ncbi:MAG: replicative DNA helicase [Ruminococcaceae bacterium]|jgi:replicative DNA helicase|nr:replicative DNA helicase [Oscillospiraceae bacterium]MBD9107511.1 replicative DNA helicase [Oscillospiraceae bacterium]MBS1477531.1 replicative DNA helicase [Angelakisella sp.]MBS6849428.1 replicative DNA helicase [Clostridiales bacterium]
MPADYMTTESRLPFSLEAEQSVLGAALLDAGCVPDLVRLVRPEFFYREQHRKIFEVISGKFTLGEPIDIVTVMEAAVREEIFSTPEETKAYLAQLAQMVPSVRNLEAYTNILQSKYHLRALITTSRDIIEQAEAPTAQPEGLLEYAEQRIYDIRNGHNNDSLIPVSRVVLETFDHLQRLSGENRADYLGISTGYGDLDRTITGLNKSDLILVAARPGMGKTAFALNIAANVALRGKKTVAIFSLEMSREQLMNRLFASEGGIDSRRLLTGELSTEDWGKVADLSPLFGAAPLYMDDTAGITVAEMKAKLRRVRNLGLVVIDYLQLMSTGRRSDNRVQEVSEITRSLKIMAKELNVPVITLSQLSRGPESRSDHRPMLSDLRESGSIEQDADIVLFLYREAYYEKDRDDQSEAECIVAKNRHGETGSINLRWDGRYTRFFSVDRNRE